MDSTVVYILLLMLWLGLLAMLIFDRLFISQPGNKQGRRWTDRAEGKN
jgi:hypothetical protein